MSGIMRVRSIRCDRVSLYQASATFTGMRAIFVWLNFEPKPSEKVRA
jgi:hypothetical protein